MEIGHGENWLGQINENLVAKIDHELTEAMLMEKKANANKQEISLKLRGGWQEHADQLETAHTTVNEAIGEYEGASPEIFSDPKMQEMHTTNYDIFKAYVEKKKALKPHWRCRFMQCHCLCCVHLAAWQRNFLCFCQVLIVNVTTCGGMRMLCCFFCAEPLNNSFGRR